MDYGSNESEGRRAMPKKKNINDEISAYLHTDTLAEN